MAAVVMVWQLIECTQSSKRAITSFKIYFDMDELKPTFCVDVITEWITIDAACFHPLQVSRITPSQLLTINLATNIFFYILQIYWKENYSPKHQACRNRHVKVLEGPWMADIGAARTGWRSETLNMQPLAQMKSYMRWRLQSCLMYFWIPPADLWHMNISDCLTLLSTVPIKVVRTSCIIFKLLNCYSWIPMN